MARVVLENRKNIFIFHFTNLVWYCVRFFAVASYSNVQITRDNFVKIVTRMVLKLRAYSIVDAFNSLALIVFQGYIFFSMSLSEIKFSITALKRNYIKTKNQSIILSTFV